MKALAAPALVLAVAVAGCAEDPYADEFRDPPQRPPAPRHAHDHRAGDSGPPPTAPIRPPTPAPGASARRTLAAFCTRWANWRYDQLDRQASALAALATGPLRDELAANMPSGDLAVAVRHERLESRGRVIALDLKPGRRVRRAVCVTHEQRIERGRVGLDGGRHVVYLARLALRQHRWALTRWQPQL